MKVGQNYLFSHPRTGANLTRYCIEFLTQKSTQGKNQRLIIGKRCVLFRSHEGKTIKKKDNLILLVRNYRELAYRPNSKNIPPSKWVLQILKRYKNLFTHYENHKGKKTIIYYEDLLKSLSYFKEPFTQILNLNFKKSFNELIENESFHRQRSFKLGNKKYSDGKSSLYYQKDNSIEKLVEFDKKAQEILGEFYIYMERYNLT